jgi:hypothetical protein
MMKWIVGGLVVLALIGAATGSGAEKTDSSQSASSESAQPTASKPDTVTQADEERPEPPAEHAEPELDLGAGERGVSAVLR